MVGKMKGNNFTDKVHSLFSTHHSLIHTDTVFSRFTSHFSLKRAGATHVALCDRVGSNYRHWCGAFTLAEAQRNTQFTAGCVTAGVDDLHGCFGKILNDNWQMTY